MEANNLLMHVWMISVDFRSSQEAFQSQEILLCQVRLSCAQSTASRKRLTSSKEYLEPNNLRLYQGRVELQERF